MNKKVIIGIAVAGSLGLGYYLYSRYKPKKIEDIKKKEEQKDETKIISLESLCQMYRVVVMQMERIFKTYFERKKELLNNTPTGTTIEDIHQALLMRFQESLQAVEAKVYEMFQVDHELVHRSIEFYQNNSDFLLLIKPLTVWQNMLIDQPLPFEKLSENATKENVDKILTEMEENVENLTDKAITEMCKCHAVERSKIFSGLKNGGKYLEEFQKRRENLMSNFKLDVLIKYNLNEDEFRNAMEQYSYDEEFSVRIHQFSDKMTENLQNYILLGSVEDVIVPDWLNNEKILEIYKKIGSLAGEWCEKAVIELCDYYKISKSNLGELFQSEKGQEALSKFTEIYKKINEEERKKIYEEFKVENEIFEAATFRARLGKDRNEEFIKEYESIQSGIEKSINAVLTPEN